MSMVHPGRFNTSTIGAVYASREPNTAAEELRRRASRDGVSLRDMHPRSVLVLYRKARRSRVAPIDSDRALRLARIASLALGTFGRAGLADSWLRRPSHALGGSAPLDLLATETGTRVVEDELARISDGVYA